MSHLISGTPNPFSPLIPAQPKPQAFGPSLSLVSPSILWSSVNASGYIHLVPRIPRSGGSHRITRMHFSAIMALSTPTPRRGASVSPYPCLTLLTLTPSSTATSYITVVVGRYLKHSMFYVYLETGVNYIYRPEHASEIGELLV